MTTYNQWNTAELIKELEARDAIVPSLKRVLNHFMDSEGERYENEGSPKQHIYRDLLALGRLVSR